MSLLQPLNGSSKLPQPPAFDSKSSYFSPPNNIKFAAKQPRRIKAGASRSVLLLTELWEGSSHGLKK